jgi:hypothetical protein
MLSLPAGAVLAVLTAGVFALAQCVRVGVANPVPAG